MRLGRVEFNIGYVVDLDNEEMVDHAKEAIMDDITSASRNGVSLHTDTDGDYSEGDIPEFLLPEEEEADYID